ncbi:MAG: hypothetical protein OEL83_08390 [Desulforhopalus sp.]|nr:hypothetical protein [Desulforhopalus sp.]
MIHLARFFLFFTVTILFSADNVRSETLLETIKNIEFLKTGNAQIIEHFGETYLVSVGVEDLMDAKPDQLRFAKTAAKMKAQKQLSALSNGENINVSELLMESTVKETGKKPVAKTSYSEEIRSKSEGSLGNLQFVGSWTENNQLFFAVAIKVKKNG